MCHLIAPLSLADGSSTMLLRFSAFPSSPFLIGGLFSLGARAFLATCFLGFVWFALPLPLPQDGEVEEADVVKLLASLESEQQSHKLAVMAG